MTIDADTIRQRVVEIQAYTDAEGPATPTMTLYTDDYHFLTDTITALLDDHAAKQAEIVAGEPDFDAMRRQFDRVAKKYDSDPLQQECDALRHHIAQLRAALEMLLQCPMAPNTIAEARRVYEETAP